MGHAVRKQRNDGLGRVLALGVTLATVVSAAGESVAYVLRPRPADGRLDVELTWSTHGRTDSSLSVSPHWGTVEDVPSLLKDVAFEGAGRVRREGQRWFVEHQRGAVLTCRYSVDPGRRTLDWKSTQHPVTSGRFFHGMGNAFLLVPDAGGSHPDEYEVTLRWQLPEQWKAVCSWGTGAHVGARIAPADLRHSIYFAGKLELRSRTRDGLDVTVALIDDFGFSPDEFADRAAAIVACQCDFMHETRFPPFVVTAVPVGEPLKAGDARLAGMGLYQSFALLVAPKSTLSDAVEHLFAHELFHYWNGRILAAQDPEKLVYWFVEGFTDYYALRILYESGHWDAATYAKWINRHIREYRRNPAIRASNTQIEAQYWSQRDTVGEVAYQRGHLLGLRWHRLARDKGVRAGLDRLFLTLVERARQTGAQASNATLRAAGRELLGEWFGPEFDRYVEQADIIEVPLNALAPDFLGEVTPVYEYELGFDRERSLKEQRVCALKPDSAAYKAGLREGDELVGWNLYGDADKKTVLRVLRKQEVKTVSFHARGAKQSVLQFRLADAGRTDAP